MKISIVTPTYNRKEKLPNLYNSIIKNKKICSDLEWLIIDDGSTDGTEELIKKWQKENKLQIKYYKQTNQGKMAALNNIIKSVTGELIIEVDSDDYLTDNCIEHVVINYPKIVKNDQVYGMVFQKVLKNNQVIGGSFPKEGIFKLFDMYFKNNAKGDACIIFKTTARKKYSYILEENERFSTEGRMYNKMDLNYDGLLWLNIPGVVCEYLEDGYSKNIQKIYQANPRGHYKYFKEMFDHNMKGVIFAKRLYIIKHYILFSKLTDQRKKIVIKNAKGFLNKFLTSLLIIPGYYKTSVKFKDERKKVLFISSTGGHLSELSQLKPIFNNYNYHLITEKDKSTKNLVNKYNNRISYLLYGTKDNLIKYIFVFPFNCLKSLILFLKMRPKVIVTTGAHTAVPICYIGKLFRKKIIYIETFANSETKTLTGKLIYPIANVFIVQWENMLDLYPKAICGGWIY